MKRALAKAATTVTVMAACAVVWNHLPARSDVYAPFDVRGGMGSTVNGRAISVAVDSVQIAPQLKTASVRVQAVGEWVVVNATVHSVKQPELPHAELLVGDSTYTPTDRLPPGSTLAFAVEPGTGMTGAWVFDVAPAALKRGDPVTVRAWVGGGYLDSRLDIVIDLEDGRVSRPQVATVTAPTQSD